MKIITSENIPIKMWLEDIEPGALQQAKNLANLPYAFRHIALMPDSHEGYGMPIGGVLAAKDVIIPNAVGVDIGCGMCAVRTSLDSIEKSALRNILTEIKRQFLSALNIIRPNRMRALCPEAEHLINICML
jgi:tRNA-splicing ligase RtcB